MLVKKVQNKPISAILKALQDEMNADIMNQSQMGTLGFNITSIPKTASPEPLIDNDNPIIISREPIQSF